MYIQKILPLAHYSTRTDKLTSYLPREPASRSVPEARRACHPSPSHFSAPTTSTTHRSHHPSTNVGLAALRDAVSGEGSEQTAAGCQSAGESNDRAAVLKSALIKRVERQQFKR